MICTSIQGKTLEEILEILESGEVVWKVGGVVSLVSSLAIILFAVATIVLSLVKKKEKPA